MLKLGQDHNYHDPRASTPAPRLPQTPCPPARCTPLASLLHHTEPAAPRTYHARASASTASTAPALQPASTPAVSPSALHTRACSPGEPRAPRTRRALRARSCRLRRPCCHGEHQESRDIEDSGCRLLPASTTRMTTSSTRSGRPFGLVGTPWATNQLQFTGAKSALFPRFFFQIAFGGFCTPNTKRPRGEAKRQAFDRRYAFHIQLIWDPSSPARPPRRVLWLRG